jgi:delta 1-pyrroline-5-carboxylate dehydrogenase
MQRIMRYIESGKQDGAKVHLGGEQHGTEGYWIQPTIFTDTRPEMSIVQEEIFGPVGVIIKFDDEEDALRQANDTLYGLAAAVFTKDITRGIQFAHRLQAGAMWINCFNVVHPAVPFGGYKQSGIGRECGQYALDKSVVSPFSTALREWGPRMLTLDLLSATPMSRLFKLTSVLHEVWLNHLSLALNWITTHAILQPQTQWESIAVFIYFVTYIWEREFAVRCNYLDLERRLDLLYSPPAEEK